MRKLFLITSFLTLTLWQPLPLTSARAAEEATPAAPKEAAPADSKEESKGEGGKDADAKKKGSDDVSGGRFVGDPIYIHVAPLVLPVINENGVEQLVTILFSIQV